jgi:hypothetical protein
VVCPRCGEPLYNFANSPKAEKVRRVQQLAKTVAAGAAARAAGAGGAGGAGGKAAGRKAPLPAVDPFPVGCFPPALQTYVAEIVKAFGCPPDYAGVTVLAAAAAAIGASRQLEVKAGYVTLPSVYAAVISPPGSAKTPVMKFVTRPLHRRQARLLAKFRKALRAHQAARERLEQARRESRKGKRSAASTQPQPPPGGGPGPGPAGGGAGKAPTLRRLLTSDATVEALVLIMSQNPRGLALLRDELVAWVLGMDRYRAKGNDRQFYLSAWSNAPYTSDRKSNPDGLPVGIELPFLVIFGTLTPDMLGEFADRGGREDGLLDRLLSSYPDATPFTPWNEETVAPAVERQWRRVVANLWKLRQERVRGRRLPKKVALTASAKKVWADRYDRLGREAVAADFPAYLRGTWAKLQLYMARLTLILHELRVACGEPITEEMADEDSVCAAAALIDYFKSHALRVRAAMGFAPQHSEVDAALIEALVKLFAASGGHWQGTSSALLQGVNAHAGSNPGNLANWPGSPESMGRAIRRLAPGLAEEKGIQVVLPSPGDKKRVIHLKKPPKPPKPPNDDAKTGPGTSSDQGGSGTYAEGTAQTAQQEDPGRAVRAVPQNGAPEPPTEQADNSQGLTEAEGGLGGLGGSPEQNEEDWGEA